MHGDCGWLENKPCDIRRKLSCHQEQYVSPTKMILYVLAGPSFNFFSLPQHQRTSFLDPDISNRIALTFFKEPRPFPGTLSSLKMKIFNEYFLVLTLPTIPWKRSGQSCPKRRHQENSSAGAGGEITHPTKVLATVRKFPHLPKYGHARLGEGEFWPCRFLKM